MRWISVALVIVAGALVATHFVTKRPPPPEKATQACQCRQVITWRRPWRYDDGRRAPAGAVITQGRGQVPPPPY